MYLNFYFAILITGEEYMHYYEKLMILVVLFLGVVIGTAGIIGVYASTVRKPANSGSNSIVLENINRF